MFYFPKVYSEVSNEIFKKVRTSVIYQFNSQLVKDRQTRICDVLPDLVPFVQFKKHKKHSSKSVTFSKVATSNTPPWMFFTFFKLCKWYQIAQCITFQSSSFLMQGSHSLFFCKSEILFHEHDLYQTRKAIGFNSLWLNGSDITQVI